jgi:membrane protease YdiL (CAAX protease family)
VAPVAPVAPPPDPAVLYKRNLRSTIFRIVGALALFIAAQVVVIMVIAFFIALTVLSQSSPLDSLPTSEELMADLSLGWVLLLSMLCGLPAFLIVRGRKMFTTDLTTVNERIKPPDFVTLLFLALGCAAILQFSLIALEVILQSMGHSLPSGGAPSSLEDMRDPVALLYIVLLGPICEEIIFRGAILRALQPYGANFAIVVSALLFALIHGYLYQAIFAFFVGLILAYCALRFSIKWAMLLHIVNNGIAMSSELADPTGVLTLVLYGLFLVLAIVVGVRGLKRFRQQREEGRPPGLTYATGTPLAAAVAPFNPYPGIAGTVAGTDVAGVMGAPPPAEAAPLLRARPFAIAFTSPWLITTLVLALGTSLLLLVFSPPL